MTEPGKGENMKNAYGAKGRQRSCKTKKLISYPFFVFSMMLYVWGEQTLSFHTIQAALVVLMIFLVMQFGNREHAPLFAFLICFDMFLLNKIFLSMLDSGLRIDRQEDREVMMHLHRSLYLALTFLWVGAIKWPWKGYGFGKRNSIQNDKKTPEIRQIAELLFYATSIFRIMEILEKVRYVAFGGGYLNYYITFVSKIPGIFRKMGDFNEIIFFVFLGTLPDPRKKKMPFCLFLLFGVLTLLYGQRNGIVTSVILIVVYLILYENIYHIHYQIIPKKAYGIALALIPVMLIALDGVNNIRGGLASNSEGMFHTLEKFLGNIGNSIRVIIYGYHYQDVIPHDKLFSVGTLTNFFRNNILTQLFTGSPITVFQSAVVQAEDLALHGNSFGNTVTYLYSRSAYLAGHGLGSSYIAEVFHDFGYAGICLASMLYGKILSLVPQILEKGWIKNTILLISFYNLLMIPRDTACRFLVSYVNLQFILVVTLVYVLASGFLYRRRRQGEREVESKVWRGTLCEK